MNGGGIFVKANKQNVNAVVLKLNSVFASGWNNIIADAATKPALAAVIPSREARTARYFFRLLQNRVTKNIKNVPGRKIPRADINAPNNSPAIP